MGALFHSLVLVMGTAASWMFGRRSNTQTMFADDEEYGPNTVRVVAIEVTSKDPDFHRVARTMFPMNWGSRYSFFKVAIPTDGSVNSEYVVHALDKHFRALGHKFTFEVIECTDGPRLSDGALEDIPPSLLVTLGKTEVLRPRQTSKRTLYHWELVAA